MTELTLETTQTAILEAFEMWKAQDHFGGFFVEIGEGDDAGEVEVLYKLRGKSHEFCFEKLGGLSRGQIRKLKQWWEAKVRDSVLLPVQQKSRGEFGANAYFRAPASGSIFNFQVPVKGR